MHFLGKEHVVLAMQELEDEIASKLLGDRMEDSYVLDAAFRTGSATRVIS